MQQIKYQMLIVTCSYAERVGQDLMKKIPLTQKKASKEKFT
jgi:hypothetical protein